MTEPAQQSFDVLIVGRAPEGLVTATMLARGGAKVGLAVGPPAPDGAAGWGEISPGYRTGFCSHQTVYLSRALESEFGLEQYGWKEPGLKAPLLSPTESEGYLFLNNDLVTSQREIAKFSREDSAAYGQFRTQLAEIGAIFDQVVQDMPDDLDEGWRDLWCVFQTAKLLSSRTADVQGAFAALMSNSLNGYLDSMFSGPLVKSVAAFDALSGAFVNPDAPGSANMLLKQLPAMPGEKGDWYPVRGGLEPFSRALEQAAVAAGVTFLTSGYVQKFIYDQGRITGAEMTDGTTVAARIFATDINPAGLTPNMLPAEAVPSSFRLHLRSHGRQRGYIRMKVALNELPKFSALSGFGDETFLGGVVSLAGEPAKLRNAYSDAMTRGYAGQPVISMVLPSVRDASLAPEEHHTASLVCQYFDPDESWDGEQGAGLRQQIAESVLTAVNAYAPNFRDCVVGWKLFHPAETVYAYGPLAQMSPGGVMPLNQIFATRPGAHAEPHTTPLPNFFLSGFGAEAGSMRLIGLNGRQAAEDIEKALKSGQQKTAAAPAPPDAPPPPPPPPAEASG